MILSKQHKFVFIKGKKVAGTSVEVLLSDVCGPEDIITPITPIDEQYRVLNCRRNAQNYGIDQKIHDAYIERLRTLPKESLREVKILKGAYYNHMPFAEISSLYGEIPENWVVFAIERCPYRKIISLANMKLNFKAYTRSGNAMNSTVDALKTQINEMIDGMLIEKVLNIGMYKDRNGKIRPEILRYERLEEDLGSLMSRLNIHSYPKLQHFKKGMSSNDMNLREIFSSDQLKRINELFAEEFECFGYEMIE